MPHPLMPRATAVWLVDNTTLNFDQIAEFCGLHPLEVQGVADGEVAVGIIGRDPIANGELTLEEIERCQNDSAQRLQILEPDIAVQPKRKGPRYTPVSKRQNRPDAIAWLVKYHPELSDAQVCKLVGTTKPTVTSVKERTHWNTPNLKPEDPVTLGMCSQTDLEEAIGTALIRQQRREERERKALAKVQRAKRAALEAKDDKGSEGPAAEAAPAGTGAPEAMASEPGTDPAPAVNEGPPAAAKLLTPKPTPAPVVGERTTAPDAAEVFGPAAAAPKTEDPVPDATDVFNSTPDPAESTPEPATAPEPEAAPEPAPENEPESEAATEPASENEPEAETAPGPPTEAAPENKSPENE